MIEALTFSGVRLAVHWRRAGASNPFTEARLLQHASKPTTNGLSSSSQLPSSKFVPNSRNRFGIISTVAS